MSLDALLSGEEEAPPQPAGPTPAKGGAVGKLVWLFRRWGWMGGLVLAAYGAATFGLGLLARFLMGPVFPPRELLLQAGGPVRAAALGFQIITVAVLVVGGLAVVGGIIARPSSTAGGPRGSRETILLRGGAGHVYRIVIPVHPRSGGGVRPSGAAMPGGGDCPGGGGGGLSLP